MGLTTADGRLGSESIPRLIFRLGIPSMLAQLVNMLYNTVDRMYIGNIPDIGEAALTGVGVVFPIMLVIDSVAALIGAGGAPLASIALGEGDIKKASKTLSGAVALLAGISLLVTIALAIFKQPLLYFFGASENTIHFANSYLSMILFGVVFSQLAHGLTPFISGQGCAGFAMAAVCIGAMLNIVLDPIFIFALDLGVRGAALATVISQFASALAAVLFLSRRKTRLRINLRELLPKGETVRAIVSLGLAPWVMQVTESALFFAFNYNFKVYGGDLYVASMAILQSVIVTIFTPLNGFRNGVQPLISYNFGAKKYERVRKTSTLLTVICTAYTILFSITVSIFSKEFACLFTDSSDVIALVGKTLPIFLGGMWIFGVQNAAQAMLVGLGEARKSLFLAVLRKILLLIPLIFLLPRAFGVMGIYWAEPIADTISAAVSVLLLVITYKKLLPKEPRRND